MDRQRASGALNVAISAAAFGAMAIFARFAYAGGAEVIAVLCLRFVLAAALMSAVMRVTRRRWPRGRNALLLLGLGAVGYVGQSFAFFSALQYASAGLVSVLLYLYPALVVVLGAIFLHQRLQPGRMLAVACALFGMLLAAGDEFSGQPLGILLGLAAALIYAVYILLSARVMNEEDPLASATMVMIGAAVVFSLLALWQAPAFPATPQGWLAVLAIAVVSTVIAMVCFFVGIQRLGPGDAATLSTLEPVVTFVLAALWLGEPIRPLQLAGAAAILGAVVFLARSRDTAA